MYIQEIIDRLEEIKAEYGNIQAVGYEFSSYNNRLLNGKITDIKVLFDDKTGQDYVEIETVMMRKALEDKE